MGHSGGKYFLATESRGQRALVARYLPKLHSLNTPCSGRYFLAVPTGATSTQVPRYRVLSSLHPPRLQGVSVAFTSPRFCWMCFPLPPSPRGSAQPCSGQYNYIDIPLHRSVSHLLRPNILFTTETLEFLAIVEAFRLLHTYLATLAERNRLHPSSYATEPHQKSKSLRVTGDFLIYQAAPRYASNSPQLALNNRFNSHSGA
jgi:hypothetical protein